MEDEMIGKEVDQEQDQKNGSRRVKNTDSISIEMCINSNLNKRKAQ